MQYYARMNSINYINYTLLLLFLLFVRIRTYSSSEYWGAYERRNLLGHIKTFSEQIITTNTQIMFMQIQIAQVKCLIMSSKYIHYMRVVPIKWLIIFIQIYIILPTNRNFMVMEHDVKIIKNQSMSI